MNTIKYRALAKDATWRYGEYPHFAPEMSNTHYPMDVFWSKFPAAFRRETLGQWTGLLDKQGKEIYEGDIVVFRDNRTILRLEPHDSYSEVCFGEYNYGDYENQESGYGWYERGITDDDGMGLDSTFAKEYLEVIGNIYESPELLK